MFDPPERAITKILLTNGGVLIKGSSTTAEVIYNVQTHAVPGSETSTYQTSRKLYIKFYNSNDLANFLRNTSEFTSKPTNTLERGYKGGRAASAGTTNQQSQGQARNPGGGGGGSAGGGGGGGGKPDVLSSTYGL